MGKWVILLVIGLPAATASAGTPEGPCDAKGMANVRRAIAQVDRSMRGLLAAQGIGEACTTLPRPIGRALLETNRVEPSQRATIVAQALGEAVEFSRAACPDFSKLFGHVASVAPKDKPRLLFAGCDYGKLGLMSEKEYQTAAEKNWSLAMLAPSLFKWLWANGMEREAARTLIRTLAGL